MSLTDQSLVVKIRTLTPLWTGGVDGTMDRIHETGILGSLRWWYEAIVRGLGGSACDPTKHEHELSGERLKQLQRLRNQGVDWWEALDKVGICDACKVFGTTGWRRRFRLEAHPVEGELDLTEGMFPSGRVHPARGSYRVGGWLLRGGYLGTLELRFTGEKKVLLCEILPTLLLIEQWGALGPKTSIGYGVIEITEIEIRGQKYGGTQDRWRAQLSEIVSEHCQGSRVGRWWWSQEPSASRTSYQGALPALTNMFFGKARFEVPSSNWWNAFREIQWLQAKQIGRNEARWTGKGWKPTGPFKIRKPLPVSRIRHWVRCHNTFPLSPIVRTHLRYGHSPETNPLLGDNLSFFGFVGKNRQQSRIHVSWAYRTNGHWEMRFWGWWLDNSGIVAQMKKALGVSQAQTPEQERQPHPAQVDNDTLWGQKRLSLKDVQVCWFSKAKGEEADTYLQVLLQGCNCGQTEAQKREESK